MSVQNRIRRFNIERMRRHPGRGFPDEITFDIGPKDLDDVETEARDRIRKFIEDMSRKHGYRAGEVAISYETIPDINGYRFYAKFIPYTKEA